MPRKATPKKMWLLFYGRFPSEKAASLFAAKSAEVFAEEGLKVTLLVPQRQKTTSEDPYAFYSVKNNFDIQYINSLDLFSWPLKKLAFWMGYLSFSFFALVHLLKVGDKKDLYYSNESLPLLFLSSFFPNTFYELHDFPESKRGLFTLFIKRMKWVLAHNIWKSKKLKERFPIRPGQLLYHPNAVDVETFDIPVTQEQAAVHLGLPADKRIVVYTGHLYGWKGVDTLAEAARLLGDGYKVVFVGGTELDVHSFTQRYGTISNIVIVGHKPHKEIPLWQKAAHVLVLPNTAKENISKYYTSPMKLFEYMASRRPVVATDIPSITEIVSNDMAFLVEADNPEALKRGIEEAIMKEIEAATRAERAYYVVQDHTWKKRAQAILKFISSGL